MNRSFLDVPARSLSGYRTAYPRVSKQGTDPDNGLASVEALFIAYLILGRPTVGLLDHYRWAEEFLRLNGLEASINERSRHRQLHGCRLQALALITGLDHDAHVERVCICLARWTVALMVKAPS